YDALADGLPPEQVASEILRAVPPPAVVPNGSTPSSGGAAPSPTREIRGDSSGPAWPDARDAGPRSA
ncbi:MAG: hypothetical protein QOG60_1638, partial [Frankiaceae bacterium]|nr:hypothetical protein [Frankiaceae bacterium]